MDELTRFLEQREGQQTRRRLAPLDGRAPACVVLDGRDFVDFSSNDYLGLSGHPAVVAAAQDALTRYGVGAGASRLMSGDLAIHHALEDAVATFKETEAALVFTSGFQANTSVIPALVDRHDAVFADALSHASLLDGVQLSRAKLIRFRHNDPDDLAALLKKHRNQYRRALVVTESVFSMDGDCAPLRQLVELKDRYECRLYVDEAHATGVFGSHGQGCVGEEGLAGRVEFIMGTFSKALGGLGAYLASSRLVVDYLVNAARGFIYTTALPPVIIAANLAALRVCREEPGLGAALLAKSARFREALRERGWDARGVCQIVPIVIGESVRALELSAALAETGFRVMAVRPPTVPEGAARLRFSLSAAHTDPQLQAVLEALGDFS